MHAFRDKLNAAPRAVHDAVRSPAQPLDAPTRAVMEPRFGHDFANVRIHADESAAAAASAVDAHAFTVNRDIVFGARQYAPLTEPGRELISHELAHVVEAGDGSDYDVILRAPTTAAPESAAPGDKERLKQLFAAVKATPIGKKLLTAAHVTPSLEWGDTGKRRAHTDVDAEIITLSESQKDAFSDCEWQQIIAMELGNFVNRARFEPILGAAEKGDVARDELVDKILGIEFESRDLVIGAYESGEFGKPGPDYPAAFPDGKMTLEDFMKRSVVDRGEYEAFWDRDCKAAYEKKHPK